MTVMIRAFFVAPVRFHSSYPFFDLVFSYKTLSNHQRSSYRYREVPKITFATERLGSQAPNNPLFNIFHGISGRLGVSHYSADDSVVRKFDLVQSVDKVDSFILIIQTGDIGLPTHRARLIWKVKTRIIMSLVR